MTRRARRVRRELHPLPITGWKNLGALPETPAPPRERGWHEFSVIECRDAPRGPSSFYAECGCGWHSSRLFATHDEAHTSGARHYERMATRGET